jgi:DNA-binding beta-propeller fold protein YncE
VNAAQTIAFVVDFGNDFIRKVNSLGVSNVVTTMASSATFTDPRGIASDEDGTTLFVADTGSHKILKITVSTEAVATLAGTGLSGSADGYGESASFSSPYGVACTSDATYVFVADTGNSKIRKIIVSTGQTSTLASTAVFSGPYAVACTSGGTYVYVADTGNHTVRKITMSTQAVATLAGSGTTGSADGHGESAAFASPFGVAVDPGGTYVFVADGSTTRVRKVAVSTQQVTTLVTMVVAGDIAVGTDATAVFYADGANHKFKAVGTGVVVTSSPTPQPSVQPTAQPTPAPSPGPTPTPSASLTVLPTPLPSSGDTVKATFAVTLTGDGAVSVVKNSPDALTATLADALNLTTAAVRNLKLGNVTTKLVAVVSRRRLRLYVRSLLEATGNTRQATRSARSPGAAFGGDSGSESGIKGNNAHGVLSSLPRGLLRAPPLGLVWSRPVYSLQTRARAAAEADRAAEEDAEVTAAAVAAAAAEADGSEAVGSSSMLLRSRSLAVTYEEVILGLPLVCKPVTNPYPHLTSMLTRPVL